MNPKAAHSNLPNRYRKQLTTASLWFTYSVLRRLSRIAVSIPCNLRFWELLCDSNLSRFSLRHPRIFYKHLDAYAAKTFSPRVRLRLLHGHYAYLKNALRPAFLEQLLLSPMMLWGDAHSYSIDLDYPPNKAAEWEGELCLTFSYKSNPLYRLVFLIMSNPVPGVASTPCIVITSIQGKPDLQQIRQATVECNNIAPAHLLMSAIGGFASGLGEFQLVGVGDDLQLISEASRVFSYNLFFEHYSENLSVTGLYHIRLPFIERTLQAKSASHRKRTRKKRLIKHELYEHLAQRTALLLKPNK
jgi:uncharacterized protein VirK/YbjX